MQNVVPVVFCFDKRIILGASIAIKSLLDCAKGTTTYDVRIFHSDLSLKNQSNLSKLFENTRHNIAFHYINPDIFKDAPKNTHSWTEIVYYRFLTPYILTEYDKAIYSDVDVLFKDDLAELYNTDISKYELGAVAGGKKRSDYFEECTNEYSFMSGLLLFNNKIFREKNILKDLLSNAPKYYKKLKWFDLDLMNITLKNIFKLPIKYCVMQAYIRVDDYKKAGCYKSNSTAYSDEEINSSIKNPVIFHYAGDPGKPWRMKKPYADYQEYINELPKSLKKYTFRDFRKKLFSRE